ncbi:MAG: hypothetical protein FWD63_08850, partial [Propionibacteriaceae bacterium]|nr:hypothetical protein [Propionibacteriaceae bacterium]
FNEATARGADAAIFLRDLHADSDSRLDPQAYVLRPDVVVGIAAELVKEEDDYERGKLAAKLALQAMRDGHASGQLHLDDREATWLDDLSRTADAMPQTAEELAAIVADDSDAYDPSKYDL